MLLDWVPPVRPVEDELDDWAPLVLLDVGEGKDADDEEEVGDGKVEDDEDEEEVGDGKVEDDEDEEDVGDGIDVDEEEDDDDDDEEDDDDDDDDVGKEAEELELEDGMVVCVLQPETSTKETASSNWIVCLFSFFTVSSPHYRN